MTNDNDDVTTRAYNHGGRIVAVAIGLGLLAAAGFDDSAGTFEVTQIVIGSQLIAAGCLAPFVARQVHKRVAAPVSPENPSDEYAYMAFLEAEILDMRASIAERDEVIDTLLAGMQSSASGVAYTSGRLRRRLHRGVTSHAT